MDNIGHDFPIYGQVEELIIWEDEKFFIATKLETLSFHKQYMANEIEMEDTRVVVSWSNLPWHGVLNVLLKNGEKFIVEKDKDSPTLNFALTSRPLDPFANCSRKLVRYSFL